MSSKTIRHEELTVPLPEGWADVSQIVAMGPEEEEGFRASLVVSREPAREKESVEAFAKRTLTQLQGSAPGFALVSEKPSTLGGNAGVLREYTCVAGKLRLAQMQFYCVKNGQAYTYTYTQRADRIASTRALAEMFFSSVRIGP